MKTERDTQRVLIARLSVLPGAAFWRVNVLAARRGRRLIRSVRAGFPDLVGCYRGTAIAIECKSNTGRLSAAQRAFRARWQGAGGRYIVCRDAQATIDVLTTPGVHQ